MGRQPQHLEIILSNIPLGLLLQLSFMQVLYDREDKSLFPRRRF